MNSFSKEEYKKKMDIIIKNFKKQAMQWESIV